MVKHVINFFHSSFDDMYKLVFSLLFLIHCSMFMTTSRENFEDFDASELDVSKGLSTFDDGKGGIKFNATMELGSSCSCMMTCFTALMDGRACGSNKQH